MAFRPCGTKHPKIRQDHLDSSPHQIFFAFNEPSDGQVTVDAGGAALPIQNEHNVVLLPVGPSRNSQGLEWNIDEPGILAIVVSQDQVGQVDYAWAFQVTHSGWM
jgi:alpha-L-fucosidase